MAGGARGARLPKKNLSDDFYASRKYVSLCLWKSKKLPFINQFLLYSIFEKLLVQALYSFPYRR